LTTLWPKKDGQPKDKASKDEISTAVEGAKKQVLSVARENLKSVTAVSEELETLNKFLTPSVIASENLTRMQTRFSSNTPLSDAVWQQQTQDWTVTKGRLNALQGITDDNVNKVRDFWLRDKLVTIKGRGNDVLIRVDLQMTNKDTSSLQSSLKELSAILADVSAAVGYELSDLQNDLRVLGKWASDPAGPEPKVPDHFITDEQKRFKAILDSKYPPQ
jgi:hypothetical protein